MDEQTLGLLRVLLATVLVQFVLLGLLAWLVWDQLGASVAG